MGDKTYARAMYDYTAQGEGELSFKVGTIIRLYAFSPGAPFLIARLKW